MDCRWWKFQTYTKVMPLNHPEKTVDVNAAAKKRKYSPIKGKRQADMVRSRMRVNLGLTFTHFRALKKRLGMTSDATWPAFCWTGMCQTVSVCKFAKLLTFPLQQMWYSSIACCVGSNRICTCYNTSGGIDLRRRGKILMLCLQAAMNNATDSTSQSCTALGQLCVRASTLQRPRQHTATQKSQRDEAEKLHRLSEIGW